MLGGLPAGVRGRRAWPHVALGVPDAAGPQRLADLGLDEAESGGEPQVRHRHHVERVVGGVPHVGTRCKGTPPASRPRGRVPARCSGTRDRVPPRRCSRARPHTRAQMARPSRARPRPHRTPRSRTSSTAAVIVSSREPDVDRPLDQPLLEAANSTCGRFSAIGHLSPSARESCRVAPSSLTQIDRNVSPCHVRGASSASNQNA
jgi:hypothetical protein